MLAEVAVEGPVSDAVLLDGVLYVGGARLAVFDLADPANPLAQAEVDLFAGSPVEALIREGGRLWALGAEGGSQRLLAIDLASPLAPVPDPSGVAAGRGRGPDLASSRATATSTASVSDASSATTCRRAAPPVLTASGSPAGVTMTDLEGA